MADLYKTILLSGVLFLAFGGVLLRPDAFGLGKLPGDVRTRAGRVTVHVPVGTAIAISVLATLLVATVTHAR